MSSRAREAIIQFSKGISPRNSDAPEVEAKVRARSPF